LNRLKISQASFIINRMTLPAPNLRHVADLKVLVDRPIEAGQVIGLNSRGKRRIIPIVGGTVTGPLLNGKILAAGADFQIIVSETSADLDARYVIELDSGEHIFVQNHALRRGSAENIAKLVRGEPVDPAEIYFRCVPTFEVSSPSLQWMTESIFLGTGARFPDHVLISIYKVE
jgi:Protein of unknown function (DUF3237)